MISLGTTVCRVLLRPSTRAAGFAVTLSLACLIVGSALPTAAADPPTGIDVSHWQGTIDWAQVRASGIDFVFAKATEDTDWTDDMYADYVSGAEGAGLLVGAYHFARPEAAAGDAEAEANHFVDTAALRGRHLLPVLDLEDHGSLGTAKLTTWVKAWLNQVKSRLGVKPIIYTTPSFWRDRMGDAAWFANHGYRLWIAHYGVEAPRVPANNWAGRGWTVWQHSKCGSVAGIQGCVDLDRYAAATLSQLLIKNNK